MDGRFVLGVDETVVADLRLHVGQQISEDELQAVVRAELVSKAKERALTLLEYRARSRAEIARRLARAGFAEDIVDETVARLESMGLIDDAQFSQAWVNHRMAGKPMGKTRIKWELRQKGVATELVDAALSSVDPEAERSSAREAATRRLKKDSGLDERTRRRKTASYLQRQGFSWETINSVLNELAEDADSDQ